MAAKTAGGNSAFHNFHNDYAHMYVFGPVHLFQLVMAKKRLTCISTEPIPMSAEDSLSLRSIKHLSAGITFELSSWLELVSSPMPTISSPLVWSPPCLVLCTGMTRRPSLELSPQPRIPPSRYVAGVFSPNFYGISHS